MLQAGIHPNVPMVDYVRDCAPEPSLSASIAQIILARSSLHAYTAHPRLNKNWQEDSDGGFDMGSATHAILLEQDHDKLAVYEGADWRKKDAQEFREQARAAGKIPVLQRQATAIEEMVDTAMDAIERLPETRKIFEGSLVEHTLIWQHAGFWNRCRPDLIKGTRDFILSYKTTGCAEPDAFIRGPLTMHGYDIQAAHEIAGNAATGGARRPQYLWLAQEIEPPYACAFIGYGPQMEETATRKLDFARALWASNIKSGKWSGYRNEIHWAALPDYHVAKFEELLEINL